ncbi:hypothetical protein ACF07Q_28585 [Nocardiopsis dassonvillei]|uniref:hypothetical protein n=1 Tax=Nocardiopsis dassonvillei TaxID=2014 RepID=UPI0036FBDE18
MSLLSRDEILQADDRKYETVHVPQWGGSVRIRSLDGKERDIFEKSLVDKKTGAPSKVENARARLVAWTVVDADGRRIFSQGDIEALGKKSAAALDKVFTAARKLSGMTDEDLAELVEDFDVTPDGASSSD